MDKANAARRLQENPDFKIMMEAIEADIFEAFRNTKLGNADELQNTHALSHGFKLINQRLDKYQELAIFEISKTENS
jgi:UTP-glucose-1-phosphate uridylyltransferase